MTTTADSLSNKDRNTALFAILSSFAAVGMTVGLSIPLISILLEHRGASSTVIGLNTSMMSVATLMFSPLIPYFIKRIGPLYTIYLGISISVVAIGIFPFFDSINSWFVLRFIIGAGMAFHWIVSETWINAIATDETRGKYIGLYAAFFSGGLAIGPIIITVVGTEGHLPFLICSTLITISAIPLYFARHLKIDFEDDGDLNIIKTIKQAPTIYVAAFVAGMTELAVFGLLSPYGIKLGYSDESAALLLTAFVAGCVLLQLPIGWFADKINKLKLFIASAAFSLIISITIPFTTETPYLLWTLIFLWGGFLFSFYTISLIVLGNEFKAGELAIANATFVMVYEIGSISGPFLGGLGMDLIMPPHGLLVVVAAGCLIGLVFSAKYGLQRVNNKN